MYGEPKIASSDMIHFGGAKHAAKANGNDKCKTIPTTLKGNTTNCQGKIGTNLVKPDMTSSAQYLGSPSSHRDSMNSQQSHLAPQERLKAPVTWLFPTRFDVNGSNADQFHYVTVTRYGSVGVGM